MPVHKTPTHEPQKKSETSLDTQAKYSNKHKFSVQPDDIKANMCDVREREKGEKFMCGDDDG